MKTCPKCRYPNPDSRTACFQCNTDLSNALPAASSKTVNRKSILGQIKDKLAGAEMSPSGTQQTAMPVAPPQSPQQLDRKVQERLQKQASLVRGRHFTEYATHIDDLVRHGFYVEAEILLIEILDAVENVSRVPVPSVIPPVRLYYSDVPPGWYRRLAVLYRKQKRYDDEVAVLERYMRQRGAGVGYCPNAERLEKARVLRDKHRK